MSASTPFTCFWTFPPMTWNVWPNASPGEHAHAAASASATIDERPGISGTRQIMREPDVRSVRPGSPPGACARAPGCRQDFHHWAGGVVALLNSSLEIDLTSELCNVTTLPVLASLNLIAPPLMALSTSSV